MAWTRSSSTVRSWSSTTMPRPTRRAPRRGQRGHGPPPRGEHDQVAPSRVAPSSRVSRTPSPSASVSRPRGRRCRRRCRAGAGRGQHRARPSGSSWLPIRCSPPSTTSVARPRPASPRAASGRAARRRPRPRGGPRASAAEEPPAVVEGAERGHPVVQPAVGAHQPADRRQRRPGCRWRGPGGRTAHASAVGQHRPRGASRSISTHPHAQAQVDAVPGVPVGSRSATPRPRGCPPARGQQDPVVRRVRLGAEHGDRRGRSPARSSLDQPGAGHPVADDDEPHRGRAPPLDGADLELRHPRDRVERVVGEPVGARPSGTARTRCPAGSCRLTRAGAVDLAAPAGDRDRRRRRRRPSRSARSGGLDERLRPLGQRRRSGGSARRTGTARAPGRWSGRRVVGVDGSSAAGRCSTGHEPGPAVRGGEALGNSRGVPGCSGVGQGQNTPFSAPIRS